MKSGWLQYLSNDVYNRLCDCRNIKADLPELVNAKWRFYKDKHMDGFTKEDALIAVLELLDCNSQDDLADITKEEYDELKEDVA